MTMKDLGNPTKKEIDDLTTILKDLKKAGHFKAFWSTFQESVTFMQTGAVVVESMWSPAVTLLQEAQFPVRYAAPKEGFRGWGGGNAILTHVTGDQARRRLRLPQLVEHAGARGHHGDAGLLQRQHLGLAQGPGLEQGARRQSPPTTTGSRARRPPRRSSAPTASRASRSAPSATAAPTRSARAASTPGTRRASTATTCCRSGRSSSPPDRRSTARSRSTPAQRAASWPPAARCGALPSVHSRRRCLTREHTLRSHRGHRSRERRRLGPRPQGRLPRLPRQRHGRREREPARRERRVRRRCSARRAAARRRRCA